MSLKIETLPNGTMVYTDSDHRFGTDALLLASFCTWKQGFSVCDLGCGTGILLLALADAGCQGTFTGIDINPAAIALLSQAAMAQPSLQINAVCADLSAYKTPILFDLLVSNPPYFSSGPLPPHESRAAARHEVACDLQSLCRTASRLAKDGGRFFLCYPPVRLAELFSALRTENLEPKRLRLVRHAPEATPWLALVEARKNGGVALAIEPDMVMNGRTVHY